jgi:catechol 2,3-dioxygenase
MSWTHVAAFPRAGSIGCDDGQVLNAVADAPVVRPAQIFPEKRAPRACASHKVVRPALHHFGLTTANLEIMVDWYARVLGAEPSYRPSTPAGAQAISRWRTAWVGDDQSSHRIAIMALPGLSDDTQRSRHKGLHHVAFAYATLDDLLATYARLKELQIEPVRAADHGATTSFYYEDPDRNSIELMVDNFEQGEQAGAPKHGTDVDPEQLLAAREAGMSVAELHERAYAGEFCSANGFYRHCLVTAANRSAAG